MAAFGATTVETTCGQCLAACGVLAEPGGALRGDPDHPVTAGYLCQNGKAAAAMLGHPGRLRRPTVRGAVASWPAALDAVAGDLRRAREEGGPDAVGLYFGAGDPAGSMAFLASAGLLGALGSRRHYNVIGLEATHRYVASEHMFGDPLLVPRPDLARAGGLVVLGTNPLISNDEGGLAASLDALVRRKAVLVVLDPRRTELASRATVHLPLRPGTDAEVLLALLHVALAEAPPPGELAAEWEGLAVLRQLARDMPPERAAAIAGVPAADILRAGRLLARVRPVAALTRLGVAMQRRATLNEWLTLSLVAVLGGLGHEGGMLHNPGFLDAHALLARAPRSPGSIVGVLPPADLADAILQDGPERLRALIVVAADPMESLPNTRRVEQALRRLDALVVLEVAPTRTTELATAVLPCAHHLEKDDVALLLPDRVPLCWTRASRPIARPPGEAESEVAILGELARRLGVALFAARPIDAAVRALSRLQGGERGMSPLAAMRLVLPLLSRGALGPAALSRGRFGPDRGKLRASDFRGAIRRPGRRIDLAPRPFVEALSASLRAAPDEETLVLSTCNRSRDFINGKTRLTGRAAEGAWVHLHPRDVERLGLTAGAAVVVETDTGRLAAQVRVDESLRPFVAGVFFGTPGLNHLTDDRDRDPFSGIPAMANVPCRIRRAEPGEGE